jgi:hypothetical protein
MRYAAAVMALALLFAGSLAAQQSRVYREGGSWIEEISGSLPVAGTVVVKLDIGNVNVQGSKIQKISYTLRKRARAATEAEARRAFAQFRLSSSRSGDMAMLEGTMPGHTGSMGGDLVVQVPRGTQFVKATLVNGGNESVSGLDGRAEIWTSAGNVHLDDIAGSIQAISGLGNFEVGNVGGDLVLNTGGGNVHINSVKGSVVISTGGGNVSIGSVGRATTVRTAGGSIDVKQSAGTLNAVTGGGIIRLSSADGPVMANSTAGAIQLFGLAHGASAQTGGGGIVAEFLGHDFATSLLQTPSGDITVYLSPNLKATVQAEVELANGHRVHSEFPEIAVVNQPGQSGSRNIRANGNLNGGGPLLRVRATAGDIEFRRALR